MRSKTSLHIRVLVTYGVFAIASTGCGDAGSIKAASHTNPIPGFYSGKIGAADVSVCFRANADADDSEFYEHTDGKTFVLQALPNQLREWVQWGPSHHRDVETFDPTVDSWWELNKVGGTKIIGQHHVPKHPPERIVLMRHAEDCTNSYEAHRLELPSKVLRTQALGDVSFSITEHPVTKVTSVRVISGLSVAAMTAINMTLSKWEREDNSRWTECASYDASIAPRFASSRWLVLDGQSAGFCFGTQAQYSTSTLSLDALSGEAIHFDLWIDSEFFDLHGPHGKLWDALFAQMRALERDPDALAAKDCDEIQLKVHNEGGLHPWTHIQPWMEASGFKFRVNYDDPEDQVCGLEYTLSFDAMREFIAADKLRRYDEFVAAANSRSRESK